MGLENSIVGMDLLVSSLKIICRIFFFFFFTASDKRF